MFALTVTDVPENLEFCVRAFAVDLLGNRIYAKDERVKSYTMEKGVLRQTREDRDFSSPASPDNQINEESLPEALYTPILSKTDGSVLLTSEDAKLLLRDNGGTFSLYMISVDAEEDAYFTTTPVTLQVVSSSGTSTLSAGYSSAEVTRYGALAKATLTSANGTVFTVEDRYFYPEEEVPDTFAIRRSIKVSNLSSSDTGYMSSFSLSTSAGTTHDAFMPHRVYGSVTSQTKIQETNLALPFGAIRDTVDGFSLAIARYQPIINSVGNYYASVAVSSSAVTIDYPSSSSGTVTFSPSTQPQIVYDLAISGGRYDSFNAMMTEQYNRHFTLQDQRVVNTDINAVLDAVCDDYKSFMLSTEGSTYTSYGLPWRVTLENGKIGPKSYQSGFVGQQIPAAAEMIWYGINRDDPESLENGLNIVNFWLNAGMMNASGVPKIWYNGDWNLFNSYPTFLRMGVDTMEGLLDAWKAASAANIECSSWYNALISYADWLVRAQNDDGSYYRCYNWSGTVFVDGDDGIPEPSGNICQSYKKDNTAMPVRFLCDMYQLTGNEDYKTAALAAAEYVYTNIYPTGVYIGGTCDNANVVDKEAGVFALYAYDAAYTLTGDSKWIPCMKQAAAFCMSMVQSFSFPIRSDASDLKAAYAFKYGYNDGSSFITRDATGVDNFAAVLYYHLFRLYVITGETCYYDQAEYIQQNTKSAMDWDGALGYPYKSLVPEATSITTFGFGSASDPDGVMGVWLPWQSVANAAPIIDMIDAFGTADVADLRRTDVEDLRDTLNLK